MIKDKSELLSSLSSEICDLSSKVCKLSILIKSPDFCSIDSLERDYLFLQRHAMFMYLQVLIMRRDRILSE